MIIIEKEYSYVSWSSSLIYNSLSSGWENVGFPSGITNVLERRLPVRLGDSVDIISASPPLTPENDSRFLLNKKKPKRIIFIKN